MKNIELKQSRGSKGELLDALTKAFVAMKLSYNGETSLNYTDLRDAHLVLEKYGVKLS
jgi:hypothetical protein